MSREEPINLTADFAGRILIIKPSALGDIVHALPLLSAVRRACPNAHITWMIRSELAPFLECVAGVDEILLFDRKKLGHWWYRPSAFTELRAFLGRLRQGQYDLVLDLQGLLRTALFAWLSGCRQRVGLAEAREGAVLFYTHTVSIPESVHLINYYKDTCSFLGVPMDTMDFGIQPPDSAIREITERLQAEHIEVKRYAVLIPGSAHRRKCWPAERFAKITDVLHQAGLRVIAVGSGSEQAVAEQIASQATAPIINFAGRTTLPQLTALVQNAAVIVGNDTGPTYIAAGLDVPAVTIFGPTNPARLGPYQRPDEIAAVDPFERGRAIDSPDPKYSIGNVTVEMVLEKLQPFLPAGKP